MMFFIVFGIRLFVDWFLIFQFIAGPNSCFGERHGKRRMLLLGEFTFGKEDGTGKASQASAMSASQKSGSYRKIRKSLLYGL
jgi:hypothetical protein